MKKPYNFFYVEGPARRCPAARPRAVELLAPKVGPTPPERSVSVNGSPAVTDGNSAGPTSLSWANPLGSN